MKGVKILMTIKNQRDETLYIGAHDTITLDNGYPLNGHATIILDTSEHKPPIYGFFKDDEVERLI